MQVSKYKKYRWEKTSGLIMSNPGVVYLAQVKLSDGLDVRIEDNIGEAIHIHYGGWRIDLSIKEFYALAQLLILAIDELITVDGLSVNMLNPIFAMQIAPFLVHLEKVELCEMYLKDIKIRNRKKLAVRRFLELEDSHIVKALRGDSNELIIFKQENFRGQSNIERLNLICDDIKRYGYPYNNQYVILFNDLNNVRDGQHRACCLYHLKGNIKVPVMRFHFKDNRYEPPKYPWANTLLRWNRVRVKGLLKKCYRYMKDVVRNTRRKLERRFYR